MSEAKKDVILTIRVDSATKAALKKLSGIDKRKLSDYVRLKLEKIVEDERNKGNVGVEPFTNPV